MAGHPVLDAPPPNRYQSPMVDRPRNRARQPHPAPRNFSPRRGKDRDGARKRPHPRTVHALDPRTAAYDTLRRLDPGELIEPAVLGTLRHHGADRAMAARVQPMVEDAVRFSFLFDHLIAHVASRAVSEMDRDVLAALHLYLAWVIHDPKTGYAHGNAAVDLLPPKHNARGFVNACVRKLSGFFRIETADEDYRAAAERGQILPLWREKCRLGDGRMLVAERAIFPDPKSDLAAHLAIVASLPRSFVDRLLSQHGPAAVQTAIAGIERPATWIRPNALFAETFHLPQWWTAQGIPVQRLERPDGGEALALPQHSRPVSDHPDFSRGGFYVQDFSAQLVAPMLGAKPGETLLDMCAAPGGKSGHLAELTGDRARILACDQSESKEERIRENIARMGYRSIATVVADAAEVRFPEQFDRILVDGPCSNSGVLARRVEARHRLDSLDELTSLQLRILQNAEANLKPGGTIVYSVCSVLMEEGVDVVHKFLSAPRPRSSESDKEWRIEAETFVLPVPAWHDGGYICRLKAPD
jgi:16S rRNA (cytosine967-C5)-methyltransferase